MKITIKARKKGTWRPWNEETNEPMWLFPHLHRNKSHVNDQPSDQQSWKRLNFTSSYSHSQIQTCPTKHSQVLEQAGRNGFVVSDQPEVAKPTSATHGATLETWRLTETVISRPTASAPAHGSPWLLSTRLRRSYRFVTMVTSDLLDNCVSIESNWFKGQRMFYASAVPSVPGLERYVSDLLH